MIWVSEETAPNRCSSSTSVLAIRVSGTGWPSLNRSGSRSSYLRSEVLIRGRSLRVERNAFQGERSESFRRDDHLARGETLEGEAAGKVAQGAMLRRRVWKCNANHTFHSKAAGHCSQG